MKYVFAGIFASEMERYLKLLREAGRYTAKIQSSLRGLDRYLAESGSAQKVLDADTVSAWIKTRDVSSRTTAGDIACIKGFAKYLASLGIEADCPESPKVRSVYVPYIFSDAEIGRIIAAADNFEAGRSLTRSAIVFPILLRVLYGCGLRLGEGRVLRWKDVDLDGGILTIREAKNLKQRFVPMDDSVTNLLKSYRAATQADGICADYLFESSVNPCEPFRNNTFYEWFRKALDAAGIGYAKGNRMERGPCPHCLRHCFTLKSFLKSEDCGRRFEDTAPILAAYLGHDSPKETEAYLRSNHTVYTRSHQRVSAAIGYLFPEVNFDEN
jgi:integrase